MMCGQLVGKIGLVDKVFLSIWLVEIVFQFILFVEYNNIVLFQFSGQVVGDFNVVGQDVMVGLQGFVDDIYEELWLFVVDNLVWDGEVYQQCQVEWIECGEVLVVVRVFYCQLVYQCLDGKSDCCQQIFIQFNFGLYWFMYEVLW